MRKNEIYTELSHNCQNYLISRTYTNRHYHNAECESFLIADFVCSLSWKKSKSTDARRTMSNSLSKHDRIRYQCD